MLEIDSRNALVPTKTRGKIRQLNAFPYTLELLNVVGDRWPRCSIRNATLRKQGGSPLAFQWRSKTSVGRRRALLPPCRIEQTGREAEQAHQLFCVCLRLPPSLSFVLSLPVILLYLPVAPSVAVLLDVIQIVPVYT